MWVKLSFYHPLQGPAKSTPSAPPPPAAGRPTPGRGGGGRAGPRALSGRPRRHVPPQGAGGARNASRPPWGGSRFLGGVCEEPGRGKGSGAARPTGGPSAFTPSRPAGLLTRLKAAQAELGVQPAPHGAGPGRAGGGRRSSAVCRSVGPSAAALSGGRSRPGWPERGGGGRGRGRCRGEV